MLGDSGMLNQIKDYVLHQKIRHDKVIKQVTYLNVQRFMLFGLIGVPVSLAHIIAFWFMSTSTPEEALWRTNIMLAHTVLMILLIVFMFLGRHATRHHYKETVYKGLQIGFMLMVMTFGVVITGFDQAVSTNVTPFIMASLVCGIALYTRPRDAILIFMFAILGFVLTMSMTISDPNILISNQVNGLTIGSLGLLLSMLLWQRKVVTLEQQAMITLQKNELEENNKQLEKLANFDLLTGLLNRFAFNQMIEKYLSNEEEKGCLLFLDIDHFKKVNDTYGHPIGDALLKQFSQDLTTTFDSKGIICRWGGDEFLVFLPGCDKEDVKSHVKSFIQSINDKSYSLNNHKVSMTISCGLVEKNPLVKESFSTIYERVDKALYQAKEKGRNTIGYN